jgi:hypothetical protein
MKWKGMRGDELVVVTIEGVKDLAAELRVHDTMLCHNFDECVTANLTVFRLLLEALENQLHLVLAN